MTLALEVKELSKTYSNKVQALKDIDLKVNKGDFVALLGKNGAGKSTFIGIISSLIKKNSGDIFLFGKNIDKFPNKVKTYIGIVPQEFNFPIFEEVFQILVNQAGYYGIDREIAHERAEKYLNMLDLFHKRNEKALNLSGGMKRRLMIARALMHEPEMLFLDEPTAGVDIEVRLKMWDFLSSMNKIGKTIILTTHYLEEAERLCNSLVIIHGGKIVFNNLMSKILKDKKESIIKLEVNKMDKEHANLISSKYKEVKLISGNQIEIIVNQDNNNLNEILKSLIGYGIEVIDIYNLNRSKLESLFIDLTK